MIQKSPHTTPTPPRARPGESTIKTWMLRIALILIALILLLSIVWGILTLVQAPHPKDTTPPVITGTRDISVFVGGTVTYRSGVQAYDETDGVLDFEVDASAVNLQTPGSYPVLYVATDSSGNRTEVRITLTVNPKEFADEAALLEMLDEKISAWGLRSGTVETVCEKLFWQIKAMMSYVSDSDKSDWRAEAYRAMTEGNGDCFTYYALARAFLERLGIPCMTVQRTPGARESTHYWLLVNVGSEDLPTWYHFDVCPRPMEIPHNLPILMRDADLESYNQKLEGYYAFDSSQYPATP